MSPSLALSVWLVLLVVLLRFDPAREQKTSLALWVPVIWMFIAGSRLPSQWLAGGAIHGDALALSEEGNTLDRNVYSVLIILAIVILVSRSLKWQVFFRRNFALTAFLCFALLSVLWSDYLFIALKRWFRDLGDYVVILVVLSDRRPLDAVRTVLRRLGYLLIPLSILLIKYFDIGRQYDYWTGVAYYVGAATSKNTLGGLCQVAGIAFFWDTAMRWSDRKKWRTKRVIFVNIAFIAMTVWLLNLSSSATSRVCAVLGCLVIAAAHTKVFQRHPGFFKALVPASFFLYLIFAFGFGLNGSLAAAVGRDPTLTGRTVIWSAVLSTHTNPLFGAGYESFWLGPRVLKVWAQTGYGINEAHNSFLDVYLNLGFIGLFLILGFMIASYRRICGELQRRSGLGSLGWAAWTILIFTGVTEVVFKNGLLWMMLLMGAVVVPKASGVRAVSTVEDPSFEEYPSSLQDAVTL